MPTRPASGWFATVTASGGHEYEVPILADGDRSVAYTPKANARPAIRLPAALSNKWADVLGDGSSDVDLEVFFDGNRAAIDTLDDVDETPGANVLVGSGGRELETRIEEAIDQEAVHSAAERLTDNNTTYTTNFDTPNTTTETNTTLATFTSNGDWFSNIRTLPTDPISISGGTVNLSQTSFTEGRVVSNLTDSDASGFQNISDADATHGQSITLDTVGEWVEYEFDLDYRMPGGENFLIRVREAEAGGDMVTVGTFIDGQRIATTDDTPSTNFEWAQKFGTDAVPDLEPGTHTVRFEVLQSGTDAWNLCTFAPMDNRFDHFEGTLDNTLDASEGHLDEPWLRPDEFQVKFEIVQAPEAVTGIRAEATVAQGASDYGHYLSNDQGANFSSPTPTTSGGTSSDAETDSLGTDFGPGITYKAGLSKTGTRTGNTPKNGFNGTDLQALTLKADLEDMPLVVNQAFDGSLASVLTQLANIGDQLWAYERDGATESIEWTTPGQRTSTKTLAPESYNVTKTVKDVYQKAAVYGQPDVTRSGERFQSDHGNAVSLAQNRIQFESEVVIDPDTGERYRRNEDYTFDYQAGQITVLAAGDMADASTFEIDYDFQPFGEFDDGTANPDTIDVNIPGLTTDYACQQAAQLIVNEVNTPLWTAEISLTDIDVGFSVVDAIDPDIVPTGGNELHVRSNPTNPVDPRLVLGSRRGVSDVVDDIRTQVGSVSRPT